MCVCMYVCIFVVLMHLLCNQQYLDKCFMVFLSIVFSHLFSLQLAVEIVIDIEIEIEIENGAEQHFTGLVVVVAQQQAICCRGLK